MENEKTLEKAIEEAKSNSFGSEEDGETAEKVNELDNRTICRRIYDTETRWTRFTILDAGKSSLDDVRRSIARTLKIDVKKVEGVWIDTGCGRTKLTDKNKEGIQINLYDTIEYMIISDDMLALLDIHLSCVKDGMLTNTQM